MMRNLDGLRSARARLGRSQEFLGGLARPVHQSAHAAQDPIAGGQRPSVTHPGSASCDPLPGVPGSELRAAIFALFTYSRVPLSSYPPLAILALQPLPIVPATDPSPISKVRLNARN